MSFAGLRRVLYRLWRRAKNGHEERRAVQARARFWQQVREGEREAERAAQARSRP